jgi:hypothetical protein
VVNLSKLQGSCQSTRSCFLRVIQLFSKKQLPLTQSCETSKVNNSPPITSSHPLPGFWDTIFAATCLAATDGYFYAISWTGL